MNTKIMTEPVYENRWSEKRQFHLLNGSACRGPGGGGLGGGQVSLLPHSPMFSLRCLKVSSRSVDHKSLRLKDFKPPSAIVGPVLFLLILGLVEVYPYEMGRPFKVISSLYFSVLSCCYVACLGL